MMSRVGSVIEVTASTTREWYGVHRYRYFVKKEDLSSVKYAGTDDVDEEFGPEHVFLISAGVSFIEKDTVASTEYRKVSLDICLHGSVWANFVRGWYKENSDEENDAYWWDQYVGAESEFHEKLAALEKEGWVELTPELFGEKA